MLRTAPAPAVAALAPQQFGKHALGIQSASENVTVPAMVGNKQIIFLKSRNHTHGAGLLADAKMRSATKSVGGKQLGQSLLESAYAQHQAVKTGHLLCVKSHIGGFFRLFSV